MSRVAIAQLPGVRGDPARRRAWLAALAARAAAEGADLLFLPEAALSGYHLAPGCPEVARATRRAAASLARDHRLDIVAGLIDGDGSRLELFGADGCHRSYLKRYPTLRESAHHRAGRTPAVWTLQGRRAGLLLCADIMQGGAWRPLVGRVDVVLVAAAWPDYRGRPARLAPPLRPLLAPLATRSPAYLHAFLPRAAAALGVPLLFANLAGTWVGAEGFTGGSTVFGPDGSIVAALADGAGADEPALLVAPLP
ncbi:MAG: carbon-nitrogen hydrolase family protein, partial [Deltaproteobacteria bacterium]